MPDSETEKEQVHFLRRNRADCPFEASAATEEELLEMFVAHAAHDHRNTEVTPELAAQSRA